MRQVTVIVMNFDIVGDDDNVILDTEFQHELSHQFIEQCTVCIHEFGGSLVAAGGQELVACFGFPVAFEDSAFRGVSAALKVLDQESDNREQSSSAAGGRVSVRGVVHTGDAIVDHHGVGQHVTTSVVGGVRTVATRLEPYIEANSIIITDAVERLVAGRFRTDFLGARQLRGISSPVRIFQVHATANALDRRNFADSGLLTPLIGRDTERQILLDRWEQSTDGLGQVVLLIGDAGLGKSRLVHEVRECVQGGAASTEGSEIVELRCSPYHINTLLHPVVEFFERYLVFRRDNALVNDFRGFSIISKRFPWLRQRTYRYLRLSCRFPWMIASRRRP